MSDARKAIEAARPAVKILSDAGYPLESQAVARLCRSAAGLRETCSRLHTDNMQLRERIKELEGLA
jgi:hypothetical protein